MLLEHPHGSKMWTYHEIELLTKRHHLLKCHMCRFNLRLPGDDRLIRKPTRLLVSHDDMKGLERTCPGTVHEQYRCHQVRFLARYWKYQRICSTLYSGFCASCA